MKRFFVYTLALLSGSFTGYVIWQDLSSLYSASIVLGQFWYDFHPISLQLSENIISRYLDPCGMIIALDCAPFLWHPIISTILGWPAGLVGFSLTVILLWMVRKKKRGGRSSKRQLSR